MNGTEKQCTRCHNEIRAEDMWVKHECDGIPLRGYRGSYCCSVCKRKEMEERYRWLEREGITSRVATNDGWSIEVNWQRFFEEYERSRYSDGSEEMLKTLWEENVLSNYDMDGSCAIFYGHAIFNPFIEKRGVYFFKRTDDAVKVAKMRVLTGWSVVRMNVVDKQSDGAY